MTKSDLLILDTHVWIWWVGQDDRLPAALRERIRRAVRLAVSAASVYELIQAVVRGRLRLTLAIDVWLACATLDAQIQVIPIDMPIAKIAAGLPPVHGDPLDRLIIATALAHRGHLMSQDGRFPGYPELAGVLISQ